MTNSIKSLISLALVSTFAMNASANTGSCWIRFKKPNGEWESTFKGRDCTDHMTFRACGLRQTQFQNGNPGKTVTKSWKEESCAERRDDGKK